MVRTRSVRCLGLFLEALEARNVPSFLPPVMYPLRFDPKDMAVGDLNGDGHTDVALTVHDNPGYVAVLRGNAQGGFPSPPVRYPVNSLPHGLRLADVNHDGKLDAIVAHSGVSKLSVLLGNGDATFQPKVDFPNNGGVRLTVADFNQDSHPDVALADSLGYSVNVLMGRGDGSFALPVTYPVGIYPASVEAADLNGDGWMDLTVDIHLTDSISVLLNRGNGSFRPESNYAVGHRPNGHTLGDIDKDGHTDLVVANLAADSISILRGNGDGTFQPKTDINVSADAPVYPVMADFNRDGKLDVAVAGANFYRRQNASVLLGKGDGTFQSGLDYPAASSAYRVAAADVNHDRYADLVVMDRGSQTVNVLLNGGDWIPPIPAVDSNHEESMVKLQPAHQSAEPIGRAVTVTESSDNAGAPRPVVLLVHRAVPVAPAEGFLVVALTDVI